MTVELMKARSIAETLVAQMRPYCRRISVAGSIRRGCPEVGDIEIVAIPRWAESEAAEDPGSLFGDKKTLRENLLHRWATSQMAVRWIKTGTSEIIPWTPKPEGRFWKGLVRDSIKLDLFLAAPDNWGPVFTIRTGCKEFSQALVTYAKYSTRYRFLEGYLVVEDKTVIPAREEGFVFDTLGVDWVEPPLRTGQHMVMRDGRPQFPRKMAAEA
jgi:DNA polymerase/3'-5' exonuclease PolX